LEDERFLDYNEYYAHFLAAGLFFACLGWLASASVFRRLP
jgi:hypothetical protein